MGNTPNNNFPYPEPTGLVKDGAQNIEDLAAAIDTTLGVYVASSPGLELINTTSFSGVSSVSLPQDTFTATYENYKIFFRLTAASGVTTMRTRTAGTDNAGSTYRFGGTRRYTDVTTFSGFNGNNVSSITVAPLATDAIFSMTLDVIAPFLAVDTRFFGQAINSDGTTNALNFSAIDTSSTSKDSLSFLATSLTGKVSVYGYNF